MIDSPLRPIPLEVVPLAICLYPLSVLLVLFLVAVNLLMCHQQLVEKFQLMFLDLLMCHQRRGRLRLIRHQLPFLAFQWIAQSTNQSSFKCRHVHIDLPRVCLLTKMFVLKPHLLKSPLADLRVLYPLMKKFPLLVSTYGLIFL